MLEMIGLRVPEAPSREFWEVELPSLLEEKLTDPEFRALALFDYIVVDEAQDLLARPVIWQCLTYFLEGGLEDGAFLLCGDFDNQVIADKEVMNKLLLDLERRSRPALWRLSENCRNYRIVGETAVRLSGMGEQVYSDYRRSGGSVENYDIYFYDDERDQIEKLNRWLTQFRDQGYRPTDVTILSMCAHERSAAAKLQERGAKLKPAWQTGNATSYTSIHSFKGMENKIVIMTDVVLGDREFQRDLFYTGMTRATESVRILCDRSSQRTLINWLREGSDARKN
jgi:superfamily I DNA/RNA helicase